MKVFRVQPLLDSTDSCKESVLTSFKSGFQRIHIIGGPGTGKSTLARRLGHILQLPVFELDKIAFQGPTFSERSLDERTQAISAIAAQPKWITEGIFVGWIEELLERADMILWLDSLPWHKAAARIVERFTRLGWQEFQQQRGRNKFARLQDYRRHLGQLVQVMGMSRAYYNNLDYTLKRDARHVTRKETAEQLARYQSKVVHCQSTDDVARFFTGLTLLQREMLSEQTHSS